MSRAVQEWIGKSDDTPVPPRVRLRIFDTWDGRDHTTGRKIMAGEAWDCDHIIALCNGGQNRESNMAPILAGKSHKEKTAADVAEKSKVARMKAKHLGVYPKSAHPLRSAKYRRKVNGETVLR